MATSPFSVTFEAPAAPPADAPAAQPRPWRFSCKEMFDVASHPANCGHPRFAALRGDRPTSAAVARFQAAGAALVGKTLQSELAFSGLGENPHYPMPQNPADPELATGGSSAGCGVAVATGAVDFSLATDSAGSARIPAACCGVLGMSLAGQGRWLEDTVALSPTLDQLGLLAGSSRELRRALQALGLAAEAPPPERVLVPWRLLGTHCNAEARICFDLALEGLRERGVVVESTATESFHETERVQRQQGTLVLAEIAASLAGFLEEHEDAVSPGIRERLSPYRGWPPERIRELRELALAPLRAFRRVHLAPLLLPTLPVVAPRLGSGAALGSLTKFVNLLGESSISLPVPGTGSSVMLSGAEPATLVAFAELVAGGSSAGAPTVAPAGSSTAAPPGSSAGSTTGAAAGASSGSPIGTVTEENARWRRGAPHRFRRGN